MPKFIRAVAAAALSVLVCAPALGQDYAIKLDRPCKVGEQYREVVSVQETRDYEAFVQGQVLQHSVVEMKAQVEADQKVLGVNERGEPSSFTYAIRKWEGSINGQPVTEVKNGMIIEVKTEEDKVSIRTEDGEFSPEVEQLLQTFLPSDSDAKDKTGMDAPFGSEERKKVGDKWPVNAAAAAKALAETGIAADEEGVTGSVVLQKVHDIGGAACMRIEIAVNVGKLKSLEMEGATANVLNGAIETALTMDLPVDASLPLMAASLTGKMRLEAEIASEQGPILLKASAATKKVGTRTRME